MKAYLNEFLNFYNYPEAVVVAFNEAYDKLKDNENLNFLLKYFYEDKEKVLGKTESMMDEAAEACGVHKYTAKWLFYALLSKQLKEEYKKAGIDEQIYTDTMEDLRYKAVGCFDVYGIDMHPKS